MDNGLIAWLPTIVVIISSVIISVVLQQRKTKLKPRQKSMDHVAGVVLDANGPDRRVTVTKETLRTVLGQAEACFRLRRYDDALELCLQCAGFNSELASIQHLLSSIYLAKSKYAEAILAARRATELEPGCTGAYLNLGQAFEAQGELEPAFEAFNQGLEQGHIDADYRRLASHFASLRAKGRDFAAAVDVLDRALKRSPADAELWFLLGMFSFDGGNYARALPAYGEALSLGGSPNASRSQLHTELGRTYAARGEWQKAIDQHRGSIEMAPADPHGHFWLAEAYFKKGDYPAAIVAFQDTIRLAPNEARAYVGLGHVYCSQGQYAMAAEVLVKALSLKDARPDTVADLYNLLTVAHIGTGRFEDAVQVGQKALTLRSTTCDTYERDAHYHLGVALHGLKRYPEAVEHLTVALACGGSDRQIPSLIHLRLGDIYVAMRDLEKGAEAYRQSLKCKESTDGHIRLGGACIHLGHYQEALLELQHAMTADVLTKEQEAAVNDYFGILRELGYVVTL